MDEITAPVSVTLSPLVSGARVDVVVLRRSWTPASSPTGTTSVQVVSGSSLSAALAALQRAPGTTGGDDQPLGAFQVAAVGGTASVSLLADLRVWSANGGMAAISDSVLSVLDTPGTTVRIGESTWTRVVSAAGVASWSQGLQPSLSEFVLGESIVGNNNNFAGKIIMQSGTIIQLSDQGGYARIIWPKKFPNGLISVFLQNGDNSTTAAGILVPDGTSIWGAEGLGTQTSIVYRLSGADGDGWRNKIHRCNWLAIGW
jgi:hypothetical protein